MTPSPFTGEGRDGRARGDGIQSFGPTWHVVTADASSGVCAPAPAPIAPHPTSLLRRAMRAAQAGPVAALIAQVLLLANEFAPRVADGRGWAGCLHKNSSSPAKKKRRIW